MAIPAITEAQKSELSELGFTVFPAVFSETEMSELALRIEACQNRHQEALAAKGGTEGISRANEITFTSHLAENDPEIAAFARRPEFLAICSELLGPDVDLYWNQAVFKMPEGAKEFPWHQDDGYTPVTPSPYLTLWLSINGATAENGTISVLPGSHRKGLVPHVPSPLGLICHDADDPDQGRVVDVPAGGIAAFWSTTMHKSGVNRSAGTRKAYILQYSKAPLSNLRTGEAIPNQIALLRGGRPASV